MLFNPNFLGQALISGVNKAALVETQMALHNQLDRVNGVAVAERIGAVAVSRLEYFPRVAFYPAEVPDTPFLPVPRLPLLLSPLLALAIAI